jgi:superfamily I DNA/RNA helicase
MIDEVQDLTYATIKLITLLTKFNNFFSGDTAQCITKGVNFRFVDLMNTIFTKDEQKPTLRQLTTNFRSQDSILQAAHAVVEVIEQLFPETIDKLEK